MLLLTLVVAAAPKGLILFFTRMLIVNIIDAEVVTALKQDYAIEFSGLQGLN
jgi:hypothetical protein